MKTYALEDVKCAIRIKLKIKIEFLKWLKISLYQKQQKNQIILEVYIGFHFKYCKKNEFIIFNL
jgi:hypothetical protein